MIGCDLLLMAILSKEVEIGLNSRAIKWYGTIGYEIPKTKDKWGNISTPRGTKITVNVEDLSDSSSTLVDIKCDCCGDEFIGVRWFEYKRLLKEDGKYYCQKCALNGYEKWVSFEEWCNKNLSKEEYNKIIQRWDYSKNIDKDGKIISPKDVSHTSTGINNKGYWFKCLDHPEHESEQRNIASFTSGKQYNIDCNQCRTISITHPHLVKYLLNKNDGLKYQAGSQAKISLLCLECGNIIENKKIYDFVHKGFSCPKCSDGISYPEKFLFNVFEQLCVNFITQLNKINFEWCNNYKYDNYIENINCIIETHGMQHYKEVKGNWSSLSKNIINDKNKEQLAKDNGIEHYVVLDCRYSDLEWIKNSVMNSELPNLLNFEESDINWLKCHEYACSSLVKKACDLWNSGITNVKQISNILKVSTVAPYLKQGVKLGWCDYNPKFKIPVICLTTGEIFSSQTEASIKYNLYPQSIYDCCRHKIKSAGKHPETGEKLKWEYYTKEKELVKSNN